MTFSKYIHIYNDIFEIPLLDIQNLSKSTLYAIIDDFIWFTEFTKRTGIEWISTEIIANVNTEKSKSPACILVDSESIWSPLGRPVFTLLQMAFCNQPQHEATMILTRSVGLPITRSVRWFITYFCLPALKMIWKIYMRK